MKSLVDEPHSFTLAEVIVEYESIIADELYPIIDKDGGDHPSSDIYWFKYNDEYKLCNLALSRLAVEALISPTLRDKIQVKFGHH